VERVPEINTRLGPDLSLARQGIAHATGAQFAEKTFEEMVSHGIDDDKAFGCDAALAAVDEPRVRRCPGRGGEIIHPAAHIGVEREIPDPQQNLPGTRRRDRGFLKSEVGQLGLPARSGSQDDLAGSCIGHVDISLPRGEGAVCGSRSASGTTQPTEGCSSTFVRNGASSRTAHAAERWTGR